MVMMLAMLMSAVVDLQGQVPVLAAKSVPGDKTVTMESVPAVEEEGATSTTTMGEGGNVVWIVLDGPDLSLTPPPRHQQPQVLVTIT